MIFLLSNGTGTKHTCQSDRMSLTVSIGAKLVPFAFDVVEGALAVTY